jgi:hypothetical protein
MTFNCSPRIRRHAAGAGITDNEILAFGICFRLIFPESIDSERNWQLSV